MSRSREGRGRKGEMNLLGPEGSAKLRTMSCSRGGYCRLKQTKHPNPCGGYGSEAAINSHKEQLCHFQEFRGFGRTTPSCSPKSVAIKINHWIIFEAAARLRVAQPRANSTSIN